MEQYSIYLKVSHDVHRTLLDVSKLKEELEVEKHLRTRLEAELKETQEAHEEERNRHKNIVLLLLTERKKIIRQFIEERKRSADLSAMLEDEKRQALGMAEGLEEESQKVPSHVYFRHLIDSCLYDS